MTTALKRLLEASRAALPLVNIADDSYSVHKRAVIRLEFDEAISEAQDEVTIQDSDMVDRVIDKSWDMGWEISPFESLCALSVVLEFPGQNFSAMKAFRDRTDAECCRDGEGINRLKRSKDIIEIAQGVVA